MPRLTRRQCGCTCANRAEWEPEGEFLPPCNCSECGGDNPCEYLVDFGCYVSCNGLTTYASDGGDDDATLPSRHVLSLPKDTCLFTDACVYSLKSSTVALSGVVNSLYQARIVGTKGECTYSVWYKFFGWLGSVLQVIEYVIPIFGCQRSDYNGTADQPCGWYDLIGMNCAERDEWLEWLADPQTFNRWELTISGTTATLVGITNGFETITYSTDEWECPTIAADPPIRNTLSLAEYPDTLTDCQKFPKSVCVMPGYANYVTPCDTAQNACDCCDAGAIEACFDFSSASCGTSTINIRTERDATLPGGISEPTAPCGYYWGCGTWCAGQICLLIWCDGSDYQVKIYCLSAGVYTLICETTATLTRCCPEWQITFDCEGSDFGGCCCEEVPTVNKCGCDVPETLFATVDYPACADVDGLTVEMTYNAGSSSWEGTVSAGACGDLDFILSLTTSGEDCIIAFQINGAEPGCAANTLLEPLDCPFVGFDVTATWDNSKCPCCPLGSFTVNIAP